MRGDLSSLPARKRFSQDSSLSSTPYQPSVYRALPVREGPCFFVVVGRGKTAEMRRDTSVVRGQGRPGGRKKKVRPGRAADAKSGASA